MINFAFFLYFTIVTIFEDEKELNSKTTSTIPYKCVQASNWTKKCSPAYMHTRYVGEH